MSTPGTADVIANGSLFSTYAPPQGAYDEVVTADGSFRPQWRQFAAALESLGPQGLGQRWEQARRMLRENGVTYNVHAAPRGTDRPWELDPLPLLLERSEWTSLADAVVQRVSLLNQLVTDLYGPQTLVSSGVLPASFLYANRGFLLPCHRTRVPQDLYLHLYAGHLARGADGKWVVLADRTQGPTGAGYAVENRIVISRTLPNDFHELHVERLAPFFIALRDTLLSLSHRNRDNPRVVLLSPGPRSATYFEDSYLARYLGYTLVEGGDLTVRGGKVFLKTLGGLVPVDVILRRIHDLDSDPLELRAESSIGVPGLVQAVRDRQVVVANALGSGILEAPALLAFLPAICRHLRSEDLRLPSALTWWCGRAEDLRYVEQHLERLIIRPAFLYRSSLPILGWRLNQEERERVLAEIREQPELYVAQAPVIRSTAPVVSGSSLQPWHVGLRVFACASQGGYRIMPGGLSRVSESAEKFGESMSAGQGSKDVWVLSDTPVESVSLLKTASAAVEVRRSPFDLPSRVADNLFWLGRHVERAESIVRHLRSALVRMTTDVAPGGLRELKLLISALSEPGESKFDAVDYVQEDLLDELSQEIRDFLFSENRPGGFYQTLTSLHGTAGIVRDRISVDSWRIINQLDLDILLPSPLARQRLGDVSLLLNQMLNLLSAFSGLATESMTRGLGWRFLDMGRRIERALNTLTIAGRVLTREHPEMTSLLEAVLEIADSSMTYRYRYLTTLQLAPVLDLLLVDETNPRAVGYQLAALAEHMRGLPGDSTEPMRTPEQRVVLAAQSMLRLTDVEGLCTADAFGVRTHLVRFLEQLSAHLWHLSDTLTQTYLMHTANSRQLGLPSPVAWS